MAVVIMVVIEFILKSEFLEQNFAKLQNKASRSELTALVMPYVLLTYDWLHKVQCRNLHMNYKKGDMPRITKMVTQLVVQCNHYNHKS